MSNLASRCQSLQADASENFHDSQKNINVQQDLLIKDAKSCRTAVNSQKNKFARKKNASALTRTTHATAFSGEMDTGGYVGEGVEGVDDDKAIF